MSEVVRSELDERTAQVVSRVYGLDGRSGATLQVVGDEYRLTRERIRQVADRVKRLVKLQPYLPRLEKCLQFILPKLPNRAESIEKQLVEHRLTANEFRLEGMRLAAELFNKPIRFEVTEVNDVRVAVKVRRPKIANEVLSIAHRSVSKSGVCAVSDIAERLREAKEAVAGILMTEPSIKWLSPDFEWFLISDSPRNRLVNLLRKVAAIAPTIDVGEPLLRTRTPIGSTQRITGFASCGSPSGVNDFASGGAASQTAGTALRRGERIYGPDCTPVRLGRRRKMTADRLFQCASSEIDR